MSALGCSQDSVGMEIGKGMLVQMSKQMTFRLGELFSGPGGMAKGAHLAASQFDELDLVHAWANDLDEATCRTYLENIPGATADSVNCGDVKNFDIENASPIDGLAFGFPCNDFSLVGKWQGLEGNFGPLYKHGLRALNAHDPSWFVAENVGGLRSANDGEAFQKILEDLEGAGSKGYKLYPHLYQFDYYGVPQRRKRIIIVGIRKDLPVQFGIPSPELYKSLDVSVRTALESPPIPLDAANQELTRQSETVIKRLSHIKPGQNAFTDRKSVV